jgi:flagellar hook capping protein FlgD
MGTRTFIASVAGALAIAAGVVVVAFTRTPIGTDATQGTSHILYADSILSAPKTIQAIQVTVQASSSYNGVTGKYTYTYTVTNEASSTGALETFGLGPVPVSSTLGSPPHWRGGVGWEGDSTLAGWSVSDNDTLPLPPTDTGNDYPSPYDLQPGQTLGGFTVTSSKPPTTIQFYAQAFDTIPAGDDDTGPPKLSQEGVTGSILGPNKNIVAVGEGFAGHGFRLRPPVPNPTAGYVLLAFELTGRSDVAIDVIDVRGSRVRALVHRAMDAGLHSVTWNGLDESGHRVAPGVYFFGLSVNGGPSERRRVVIVR